MKSLPDVVSPQAFILTLPFLLLYIHIAQRTFERIHRSKAANWKQSRELLLLIILGCIFIILMLVFLLPITHANGQFFGWLFSWFCGHGWPAILIMKSVVVCCLSTADKNGAIPVRENLNPLRWSMDPKTDLAIEVIKRALRSNDLSEKEVNEIAFHLTDWIDDLRPFVDLLENPTRYNDEEVRKVIIAFLVHAPDHLKVAAETILEAGGEDRAT